MNCYIWLRKEKFQDTAKCYNYTKCLKPINIVDSMKKKC